MTITIEIHNAEPVNQNLLFGQIAETIWAGVRKTSAVEPEVSISELTPPEARPIKIPPPPYGP
jgi:hypothetical protein